MATRYKDADYVSQERWDSLYTAIRWVLANMPPEGTLLNVGKGPGLFEAALHQLGYRVVSVDIDSATEPDLVGDVGNLARLIGEERFSLVTCFQVLEHLPKHALPGAISQLSAARAHNGRVLISVPQYGPLLAGEIKLPGLPRLAYGYAFKRSRAGFRAADHEWELGHGSMPLQEFFGRLRTAFTHVESWVPSRNPYHRFFACH